MSRARTLILVLAAVALPVVLGFAVYATAGATSAGSSAGLPPVITVPDQIARTPATTTTATSPPPATTTTTPTTTGRECEDDDDSLDPDCDPRDDNSGKGSSGSNSGSGSSGSNSGSGSSGSGGGDDSSGHGSGDD